MPYTLGTITWLIAIISSVMYYQQYHSWIGAITIYVATVILCTATYTKLKGAPYHG